MKWINKVLPVLSIINIVAAAIAGLLRKDTQSYIFIGIAFLFGLVWGLVRAYKRNTSASATDDVASDHRSIEYRKQRYNSDFMNEDNGRTNGGVCVELRRSTLSYRNNELTQIGHRKEFKITALVNSLREFTDRYQYSADNFEKSEHGICKLNAPQRGQHITSIHRVDGFVFYTIHDDNALRQSQTKQFVMEMEPIPDPQHRMHPFLSTGIYEPTKRLELILKYPPKANLKDPVIKIFNNYGADVEIDEVYPNREDKQFTWDPEHGQLKYAIDYPIFGYKYKMEWYFDN